MNIDKQELDVFRIVTKREDVLPVLEEFQKDIDSHDHADDCKMCVDKAFMS